MSQLSKKQNLPSLHLYVLLGPSTDEVMSTHLGEDDLLYSVRFKRSSLPKTPSEAQPEVMFYQLSGHLLTQSS